MWLMATVNYNISLTAEGSIGLSSNRVFLTITKNLLNYLSFQESLHWILGPGFFCRGGVEENFHFNFFFKFSTMSIYSFFGIKMSLDIQIIKL